MSEAKDPTLKLFGKSIPFQELLHGAAAPDDYNPEQGRPCPDSHGEEKETEKDTLGGKPTETEQEAEAQPLSFKEQINPDAASGVSENPKTPSVDETLLVKMSEEELSETSVSQEKTLKKPDKIIPCPRCNSMDTKFCYYNNYNVNQARHLCRSCQRYWTAGGTMRNVPVGAGRRKSKNSHIAISEAHHPSLQTVLTFGSDSPLHEDANIPVSGIVLQNGDDGLNGSSVAASSKDESVESVMRNSQGCFPGAPWAYPAQWTSPPFFFPPGFPILLYPTGPYWACAVPGSCNNPCFVQPPSPIQTAQTSPILGKHSREENEKPLKSSDSDKENNPKRCLWIPKTLRVDDPGEAAKSSIWTTLGIKYDKADSISGPGLFKAFRSKLDENNHMVGTSPVLHANPAALSRSLNFQESS